MHLIFFSVFQINNTEIIFALRYCFVEMAHDKGLLSSPEYAVMCQWYEFIEKNVDIGLDLIGGYYFVNISLFL